MNRIFRFLSVLVFILAICSTCKKDDDWYHISAYEEKLHRCVNEFRELQGKDKLVLQPVMVVEAQGNSKEWRDGANAVSGLQDRFEAVIEKLGGTNYAAITSIAYNLLPADSVVNRWIADTATRAILLDVYTQSGPGIAFGDDNEIYITHMFLNIPKN
jgi:hypothetical protein